MGVDTNALVVYAGVNVTYRALSDHDRHDEYRYGREQFSTLFYPQKAKIYPAVVEVSDGSSPDGDYASHGQVGNSASDIELDDVIPAMHDSPSHEPHQNEDRVFVSENCRILTPFSTSPTGPSIISPQDYYDHRASSASSQTTSLQATTFGNLGWFVWSAWVQNASLHKLFITASPVHERFEGGVLKRELPIIEQYVSKVKYLLRHKGTPVMVVFVNGHVGRIVHAYIDGEYVHLWVSELVDTSSMTEEDGHGFLLLGI
ncbi:hypothetical protein BDW67DRAFT_189409 [Aspergillus spinulosporus]